MDYEFIASVYLIFDSLPMVVEVRHPNIHTCIQIPKYHTGVYTLTVDSDFTFCRNIRLLSFFPKNRITSLIYRSEGQGVFDTLYHIYHVVYQLSEWREAPRPVFRGGHLFGGGVLRYFYKPPKVLYPPRIKYQ